MKLEDLKKLVDEATPGPWKICPRDVKFYPKEPQDEHAWLSGSLPEEFDLSLASQDDFLGAALIGPAEPGREAFTVLDAAFIAAARTYMPRMHLSLERIRERCEEFLDNPLSRDILGEIAALERE